MKRVQIVVTRLDNTINYYTVEADQGWRVDPAFRCIVIGRFPRTYIPLDTVASFTVEPFPTEDSGAASVVPASGANPETITPRSTQ